MKKRASMLVVFLILFVQLVQGTGWMTTVHAQETVTAAAANEDSSTTANTEDSATAVHSETGSTTSPVSEDTSETSSKASSETAESAVQADPDANEQTGEATVSPAADTAADSSQDTSAETPASTDTAPQAAGEQPAADSTDASASPAEADATQQPAPADTAAPASMQLAAADTGTAQVITENLITSVNLTVLGADGKPAQGPRYDQGSGVQLDFNWALKNGHNYGNGATFTFDLLPADKFVLFNDITGDLVINGDENVGTFTVSKSTNKITMNFNEFISQYDEVHGTLQLNSKFDKQKITGSTEQAFVFPISTGEQQFNVKFKPIVNSTITKKGTPDKKLNAQNISWSIDFNKKLDTVNNANLTDELPQGLTFNPASVVVTNLNVNLDGSITTGTVVDPSEYVLDKTPGGKDFVLRFNSGTVDSAYRIDYSTAITSGTSFANTAVFGGDNIDNASATATVNLTIGEMLKKRVVSYDSATQTINWEIRYNYGERGIARADALLSDLFTDSQVRSGDIKVTAITFDANGNTVKGNEFTGVTVTNQPAQDGKTGFTLQFDSDVQSAYLIEYSTKAASPVFNGQDVTNTVTSGQYSSSATQKTQQVYANKYLNGADYTNETASWRIVLNQNKATMNNVTIEDQFPNAGLVLQPATLKITDSSNNAYTDYILEAVNASGAYDQGFRIIFNTPISDAYTITYKTNFDMDTVTGTAKTFANRAQVGWIDSHDNQSHAITTTASFNPNNSAKNNGYKSGSYNPETKQITWTVGVNYNRDILEHASMDDQLLQSQQLVPGSLTVNEMNVQSNGSVSAGDLVSADLYTITYNKDSGLLQLDFNQSVSSGYIITFTTSLEGNLIDSKVDNTAVLKNNQNPVSEDLKASVTIPHGGQYVSKSGMQNGDMIDWNVMINESQSFVSNARLTDTPTSNQILVPESLILYTTSVDANGTVTKKDKLVEGKDYELVTGKNDQGQSHFVLTFTHDISSAYVLQYQTLINAENGDAAGNSVKFEGTNIQAVSQETSKEVIVGVSSGSGSGSGVRGQLTVVKVDAENPALKLAGAQFTLERKLSSGSRVLINTLTTDAAGRAIFTKLLSGEYILKEVSAPEGYAVDLAERSFTISASNLNQTTTVTNNKIPVVIVNPAPSPGGTGGGAPVEPKPEPEKPVVEQPIPENSNKDKDKSKTANSSGYVAPAEPAVVLPVPVTPEPIVTPVVAEPVTEEPADQQQIEPEPVQNIADNQVPGSTSSDKNRPSSKGSSGKQPDTAIEDDLTDDGENGNGTRTRTNSDSDQSAEEQSISGEIADESAVSASDQQAASGLQTLPQTGESSHWLNTAAGMTLIVLGFAGVILVRRKQQRSNQSE
ncbi:collagen binding domain-containing protein [Paenibacillus sp. Z6-24]